MPKRRILLTNDDGITSQGLDSLCWEMKKIGEVFVIAPVGEQSGASHAITLKGDIEAKKFSKNGKFFGYAINGTPVDCVKLGIVKILSEKPDLVISGINHGENTGLNVLYSGTVSAAKEAALYGIPAFAISVGSPEEGFSGFAAKFARKLAEKILKVGLPNGTLLNVNIPPVVETDITGISITRQGNEKFLEDYKVIYENSNKILYRPGGKRDKPVENLDTEGSAIHRKEISITPIHFDMTDYKMIEELKKWDITL